MPSKGELQLLVLLISCSKYERFSKENLPIDHTRVPEVEPTIILMLWSPRLISFFLYLLNLVPFRKVKKATCVQHDLKGNLQLTPTSVAVTAFSFVPST